ncbi:MAG: hypothetical protein NXI20_22835 [bacterium]|nr:hypothetical protein [bacterium]
MKQVLIIILTVASTNFLMAQKKREMDTSQVINQTNRLEIEINDEDYDFTVIPGEEKGLMLVTETTRTTSDGLQWMLQGIDTALNIQWKKSLVTPFGSYFKGYEYSDNNYYLLYGTSEYRREDLTMWRIDADTQDTSRHQINTVFPIDLKYFEIVGNTAIFGGYAFYKPVIMLYDMNTKRPKVLPGIYNNFSEILDVVPNDDMRIFTVIMTERMPNKLNTVSIKSYTADGTLIQNRNLLPGEDKSLLDGASTTFLSGYQYVAGTYSRKKSEFSRGLYLSRLKNGIQEFIKFHNYGDLNNFFSYMSERREKRVKERIERRKSLGKKIKFNYRLMVHDIIERENEYILVGEAYYPRYRSTSSTYGRSVAGFGGFGGVPNSFNPYFIGYRYTHAVVVGFSKSGDIIWDNSFEINDVQTPVLREFVNVTVDEDGDKIVLLYLYDNTIRSKIIQGDKILEGITFNPVKLSFESDEARSTDKEVEGLEKWYDNKLFGYGKQKIKNLKDKDVKLNRRIFYINKIEYEKGLSFQ